MSSFENSVKQTPNNDNEDNCVSDTSSDFTTGEQKKNGSPEFE